MQTTLVEHIEPIADAVVAITLRAGDAPLAPWQPGAHIDLVLPNWLTRQYSLCGSPTDRDRYQIAVRHDPRSRGGSEYLNLFLRTGRPLQVSEPRNHFPLHPAPRYAFVAGGIGITAILPMMRAVTADPAIAAELLYVGHHESTMPFAAQIRREFAARATVVATGRDGRPDLADLTRRWDDHTAVYCCGPASMLDACAVHVPAERLHVERFRPAAKASAPNTAFDVLCARTRTTVTVGAHETMLDALLRTGHHVGSGCREGVCGSCHTIVIEGTPDHRDDIGAAPGHMYPCVSRALGSRLTVDL